MIKIRGYSKQFKNLNYITLKIKDAIVDKIKKIRLSRPSINKVNPDIIISVFISDSKFIIYILPGSTKFSRHALISTCEARLHLPSQFPDEIGKEGFNTVRLTSG